MVNQVDELTRSCCEGWDTGNHGFYALWSESGLAGRRLESSGFEAPTRLTPPEIAREWILFKSRKVRAMGS